MATITSAKRRRERRQRAIARHELYVHRKRIWTLTSTRLKKHLLTLRGHHSRDKHHLLHIALLAGEMATTSWRCLPCWKVNSPKHPCCPYCGLEWKEVHDESYVAQETLHPSKKNKTYTDWGWEENWDTWQQPWTSSSARAHTPRQNRPYSPHRGQNKGKNKGKGKGKKDGGKGGRDHGDKAGKGNKGGKSQAQYPLPPEPAPAWASTSQTVAKEAPSTTPRKLSSAEQRLQELTDALNERDVALSSKVQTVLSDQAQKTEKEAAQEELQEINGAASRVYQAKKQLSLAENARFALHQTWNVHIADSLARWRGYASEFQEQDAAINKQIEEATAALNAAQTKLEEVKETTMEAVEISDSEANGPEKMEAAAAITEGMALQQRAEALAAAEPPPKKFKAGDEAGAEPGKLGSGALAPFGSARKSTLQ